MNITLKVSLEAEVLDQVIANAQNVLDLVDKLEWINHGDRLAFIQEF